MFYNPYEALDLYDNTIANPSSEKIADFIFKGELLFIGQSYYSIWKYIYTLVASPLHM